LYANPNRLILLKLRGGCLGWLPRSHLPLTFGPTANRRRPRRFRHRQLAVSAGDQRRSAPLTHSGASGCPQGARKNGWTIRGQNWEKPWRGQHGIGARSGAHPVQTTYGTTRPQAVSAQNGDQAQKPARSRNPRTQRPGCVLPIMESKASCPNTAPRPQETQRGQRFLKGHVTA